MVYLVLGAMALGITKTTKIATAHESGFQGASPAVRALAVAPALALVVYLVAFLVWSPELGVSMLRILPIHMIPMGSESSVVVLIMDGMPLSALFVFLCISDLTMSMPFLIITEAAKRMPVLGSTLTRMEAKGASFYRKHDWLKRLGPFGLMVFVALPLSGTGTTMGVLVGRVAGFSAPQIAIAVLAGTVLRWSFVVGGIAVAAAFF